MVGRWNLVGCIQDDSKWDAHVVRQCLNIEQKVRSVIDNNDLDVNIRKESQKTGIRYIPQCCRRHILYAIVTKKKPTSPPIINTTIPNYQTSPLHQIFIKSSPIPKMRKTEHCAQTPNSSRILPASQSSQPTPFPPNKNHFLQLLKQDSLRRWSET